MLVLPVAVLVLDHAAWTTLNGRTSRSNASLLASVFGGKQLQMTCVLCFPPAVLMAQAHIFWEMEDYPQAEALLEQCSDVCQDHSIWRCNLAHATFMQGLPCPHKQLASKCRIVIYSMSYRAKGEMQAIES